jgi:hypothetical protein
MIKKKVSVGRIVWRQFCSSLVTSASRYTKVRSEVFDLKCFMFYIHEVGVAFQSGTLPLHSGRAAR